jgi:hypothetical protein
MKKLLSLIILFFSSIVFALDSAPSPKVLLNGGELNQSLSQQININKKIDKSDIPKYSPSNVTQTISFGPQINNLNKDIEVFIKKMTPKASSLTNSELTDIYLSYKKSQQINVLLHQQQQVLLELRNINSNINTIVNQDNQLISILSNKK